MYKPVLVTTTIPALHPAAPAGSGLQGGGSSPTAVAAGPPPASARPPPCPQPGPALDAKNGASQTFSTEFSHWRVLEKERCFPNLHTGSGRRHRKPFRAGSFEVICRCAGFTVGPAIAKPPHRGAESQSCSSRRSQPENP